MGEDYNGVTSVMTPGYHYICIPFCVNCGKRSLHDYKEDMEWDKCPYCGYSIGIREKPVEKQSNLGDF